jgi:bla regulator protein blaR1
MVAHTAYAYHDEVDRMSKGAARAEFYQKALSLVAISTVIGVAQLCGQVLHATGPLPSFEVATIKPASGQDSIPSKTTPAECRTINVTTRNLIEQAYQIPWTLGSNDRVLGGPGWIDSNRYDIDARIDESLSAALEIMPNDKRKEQTNLMMQSLLADRFKLKVHFALRELPVFALVVAKGGPKLTPAPRELPPSTGEGQPTANVAFPPRAENMRKGIFVSYDGRLAEMTSKQETLDDLVHWLAGYSEIGGRTVLNRTGLTGNYDFKLRWARERLAMQGPEGELPGAMRSADPDGPSLFTALQEQLGLRLMPTKGPVEVLVIDDIELPSAN